MSCRNAPDGHPPHWKCSTTMGYEGMMSVVTQLTNAVLEQLDKETIGMGTTDYNFDLVR